MSTTYADLEAQETSCSPRLIAMSIFIEALRSEGLRLSNTTDVERIARLSVQAAQVLLAELPGPTTGPTSRPLGATIRQDSDSEPRGDRSSGAMDSDEATVLGSIEDAPVLLGHDPSRAAKLIGICAFCKTNISKCVCPHGMRSWMAEIRGQTPEELLADQEAKAVETGSLATGEDEGRFRLGVTAYSDLPGERLGLTSIHCQSGKSIGLFVGGTHGESSPKGSVQIAERMIAKLNELDEQRAAAVRRADVIAAERDRLAGQVTVLKLRARDLEEELEGVKRELSRHGEVGEIEVESMPVVTRRRVTKDAEIGDQVRTKHHGMLGTIVAFHDEKIVVALGEDDIRESFMPEDLEYIGAPSIPSSEHCGEQATMDAGSVASEGGQA